MGSTITPTELQEFMISKKIPFVRASQIAKWIGCTPEQVPTNLRQVREAGQLTHVTTSGWAVAENGKSYPDDYLDLMMSHLGCDYYLAGHSAASHLGVHTHSIGRWTVVVSKRQRSRVIGKCGFKFLYRKSTRQYPARHKRLVSSTFGIRSLRISEPATTLLDVTQSGVFYMVANIAGKMLDYHTYQSGDAGNTSMLDPYHLANTAKLYPVAVRQRTGHILSFMSEWVEEPFDLAPLLSTIPKGSNPVNLFKANSKVSLTEHEYDPIWNVSIDGDLDPDL